MHTNGTCGSALSQPVCIDLPDAESTARLAGLLANCLPRQVCIWLSGEPGSGKTHLARALLRALGWQGAVRSPTYSLLETYQLPGRRDRFEHRHDASVDPPQAVSAAAFRPTPVTAQGKTGSFAQEPEDKSRFLLYHFDLYRMASPEEWSDAGFDDLPDAAVRLIEWPERGLEAIPPADLWLVLQPAGAGRSLRLEYPSRLGEETWHTLESALQAQAAGSALHWSSDC